MCLLAFWLHAPACSLDLGDDLGVGNSSDLRNAKQPSRCLLSMQAYSAYRQACADQTGQGMSSSTCSDLGASCAWQGSGCSPTSVALVSNIFGAGNADPGYEAAAACVQAGSAADCAAVGTVSVDATLLAAVASSSYTSVPDSASSSGDTSVSLITDGNSTMITSSLDSATGTSKITVRVAGGAAAVRVSGAAAMLGGALLLLLTVF